MDIWKNLFSERVVKLPRSVVESSSLEILKRHVNVILRDTFSGGT